MPSTLHHSHDEINSREVKVAMLAFAAIVNILGKDSDITTTRFFANRNMIDCLNFEDANAIIFDFGIIRKVANGFADECVCDFKCGCLVVYVHGVFCFVYCCGRIMADFSDCVNFILIIRDFLSG